MPSVNHQSNRDDSDLIVESAQGLHCPAGDFWIDPWKPVDRAIITHAHSDHARAGSKRYLCAADGADVLRLRLGSDATIQTLPWSESVIMANDVRVSVHPAGHLLGSAQVRIEHRGEVWVVSGDYKTQPDPTCQPFEVVPCTTFITECTFGLPIYRWPSPERIFEDINGWWNENQQRGRTSILFAYALGKAQRVLASVDASLGPIIVHGAVARLLRAYEAVGIRLPPTLRADPEIVKQHKGRALVIAPPSAANTPWLRKFGAQSSAFASGWMHVRGNRRRRNVDRGFALSDHVDWDGVLSVIRATGASRIGVTHGYTEAMARYLREQGFDARIYRTRFSDMGEDEAAEAAAEPPGAQL